MAKKGNGEGSIYPHKKNGKKVGYRGAYWVHTAGGPKRRYVSGKTRDEVRDKLIEALGNRAQGLVFDAGSITVGEYLTRWLKDSVKGTVRVSTYEVHRHMVHPHIVPALGRIKLKESKTTLLHRCCTKAPDMLRGLFLSFTFYLQNARFSSGPAWTRTRDLFLIREAL